MDAATNGVSAEKFAKLRKALKAEKKRRRKIKKRRMEEQDEDLKVIDYGGYFRFAPVYNLVKLPGGIFTPSYDSDGAFLLNKTVLDQADHDYEWVNDSYFPLENYNEGLVDLENNIERFLKSKELYEENGIDYRRSALLFGPPGTGKTQYIENKCGQLVERLDAVVVRISSFAELECFCEDGARILARNIPDRFKIIVLEELNSFVEQEAYHVMLTEVLDSPSLRQNLIVLATTNYPEELPQNFVDRPSRLDLLIPVYSDENDPSYLPEWYKHLMGEEFPVSMDEPWVVEALREFSPAYFKELFIYSKVINSTLEESYERLRKRRKLINSGFKYNQAGMGFGINVNGIV